jgi:hypothetical protein
MAEASYFSARLRLSETRLYFTYSRVVGRKAKGQNYSGPADENAGDPVLA